MFVSLIVDESKNINEWKNSNWTAEVTLRLWRIKVLEKHERHKGIIT